MYYIMRKLAKAFLKRKDNGKCVAFFLIRKLIACLATWAWHSLAQVWVKAWFPILCIVALTILCIPSIQWMFVKIIHCEHLPIQWDTCQCNSQSIQEPSNSPFTNWCPTLGKQSRPKLYPGLSINFKHLCFMPLASWCITLEKLLNII